LDVKQDISDKRESDIHKNNVENEITKDDK